MITDHNTPRRSWPVRFWIAALLALGAGTARSQDITCQPLSPREDTSIKLEESGAYCLETDLHIRNRPWLFPDGRSGLPGTAVSITSDNVNLDLRGHTIQPGDVTGGIQIRPKGPDIYQPGRTPRQPQQITLRNGILRVPTSDGIGAGFAQLSIFSDMGDASENFNLEGQSKAQLDDAYATVAQLDSKYFHRILAVRPAQASGYQQRNIHIEKMHIDAREGRVASRARAGAINIQGAGTVIRDCVIETDAGTAIWIFGPNALIENNTIIVHGAAPLREADAPIRLHYGDGAVIRNNKFIVKDAANHRGISVFDTGAFTLENNTFYGMNEKDEVAKAFTGVLYASERNSRFEPAWKALMVND